LGQAHFGFDRAANGSVQGNAVYNGERRGGTAATLRYAKKLGRELIVIHPLSLLISHIS